MMKNKYDLYKEKCEKYTEAILYSTCNKKIIIAGPGTGKSFLFKKICRAFQCNSRNVLVLSFINELVDNLAKELYGMAEVRTLHSFALSQLPRSSNKFSLNVEATIEEDYEFINDGKKINFGAILCNLVHEDEALKFYSNRRKYYNVFGPNCSVYALVKYLKKYKDKIPTYSQIMIDEFQDFNNLEVVLIDLLSEKSPILIVGDDDQSLYSFRYANPDKIRSKIISHEYTSFEMPFCMRCTKVIIDSFNSVVKEAKNRGYLTKRIIKPFKYFFSAEKDKVSNENLKIMVRTQIYQTAVAYNIEKELNKIINQNEEDFSILIICSLKKQITHLAKSLRKKGFRNIKYSDKNKNEGLIEGFRLLLDDKKNNFGWRLIAKYILQDKLPEYVKESYLQKEQVNFVDLLTNEDKKKVNFLTKIVKKITNNRQINRQESEEIVNYFGYDPYEMVIGKIRNDLEKSKFSKTLIRNIPIKLTNIPGSKGLTSDYVFIVNFDDKYILEKGEHITDEVICKFLVAITRAKKRVYIYTSQDSLPTFVNWIDRQYIEC
jgi:hypothetical protein